MNLVSTSLLVLSLFVKSGEAGILGAAAAGGAAAAAGEAGIFNKHESGSTFGRNSTMDFIAMVVIVGFVVGIVATIAGHWGVRLFRKYVLKIVDPPRSFVIEKKVKCTSGIKMMIKELVLLHSSASLIQATT